MAEALEAFSQIRSFVWAVAASRPGYVPEGKSEKAGTQHKPKRIIQKGMPHTLRPPE